MDIISNSSGAAGIASGHSGGMIEECFHIGNIYTATGCGGIVGHMGWTSSIVKNCYSIGDLSSEGTGGSGVVGGIRGRRIW